MADEITNTQETVTTEPIKTFTQEDVNKIVQGRVGELNSVIEELKAFGYEGSPKEIKEAIRVQRETYDKQRELTELQQEASETGVDPEILKEIKELKKDLADLKSERNAKLAEIETKKQIDENWNIQVKTFSEKYSDINLDELGKNTKFIKFIKGKQLPLVELYEDFVDFIGESETDLLKNLKSKDLRSTTSGKGGALDGGSYGLTDTQKELATDAGIPFKRYAEIYNSQRRK